MQRKIPITLFLLRLISIAPMVTMTLGHPKLMYVDLWYAGEHQENILGAVSRRYRDSPQKYPIDTDPVKAVPIVGPTSFPNSYPKIFFDKMIGFQSVEPLNYRLESVSVY